MSDLTLEGKVALVTGGGSGVGASIAGQFAAVGARVVIVGRHEDKLRETRDAIRGGEPVRPIAANVADRGQVRALVGQVVADFGRIDILVNNAGVNIAARQLDRLTPEDWDTLLQINVTGAFNMIHAVLPQMRAQRAGLIISISSISGLRPSALAGAAYSASKHALAALTKVVDQEENGNGIRTTVISPGDINTPLLDHRPNPVGQEQRANMLQPDDVAAAALFVATLPAHVCVPELVIKPAWQMFA